MPSDSIMSPKPLALPPALPSELLTYVLQHQTYPTTLIICQPRAAFLSSLLSSIPSTIQRQPPLPPEDDSSELQSDPIPEPPPRHPLLIPTLQQVAASRYINLVFVPTVSHLRAYVAVFPPEAGKEPPEQKFDKPGTKTPFLVVYRGVELHRDTSEWSAQGLGNSLAGLVEAGERSGRQIVLIEERKEQGVEDRGDWGEEEIKRERRKIWEERVPMLNGSVRRAGLESEDGAWSGRTVEVGRVLARWFKFRREDWESEEQG